MRIEFFAAAAEWRAWLTKNGASARELWVGYYKVASGRPSMTWPESVDEALCFGWIDGLRKSIDQSTYKIRFTPRKPETRDKRLATLISCCATGKEIPPLISRKPR